MPAKDAAARFPFDDTTTHMCVYNVRTRGKEERNRERERRGRRTKAGFMKRRVCRRRARFTWNEIRGVVHILLFDAVKNRKRERERMVVGSYVTARRDPDCIFDAGLPLAAIKRLIRLRHCARMAGCKSNGKFSNWRRRIEGNAYLSRLIDKERQVDLNRKRMRLGFGLGIFSKIAIKIWKEREIRFRNFVNKKVFGLKEKK